MRQTLAERNPVRVLRYAAGLRVTEAQAAVPQVGAALMLSDLRHELQTLLSATQPAAAAAALVLRNGCGGGPEDNDGAAAVPSAAPSPPPSPPPPPPPRHPRIFRRTPRCFRTAARARKTCREAPAAAAAAVVDVCSASEGAADVPSSVDDAAAAASPRTPTTPPSPGADVVAADAPEAAGMPPRAAASVEPSTVRHLVLSARVEEARHNEAFARSALAAVEADEARRLRARHAACRRVARHGAARGVLGASDYLYGPVAAAPDACAGGGGSRRAGGGGGACVDEGSSDSLPPQALRGLFSFAAIGVDGEDEVAVEDEEGVLGSVADQFPEEVRLWCGGGRGGGGERGNNGGGLASLLPLPPEAAEAVSGFRSVLARHRRHWVTRAVRARREARLRCVEAAAAEEDEEGEDGVQACDESSSDEGGGSIGDDDGLARRLLEAERDGFALCEEAGRGCAAAGEERERETLRVRFARATPLSHAERMRVPRCVSTPEYRFEADIDETIRLHRMSLEDASLYTMAT